MSPSPLRLAPLLALLLAAAAAAAQSPPPARPSEGGGAGANLPGGKPFTRITADMLNFDYGTNRVAIFEGNVVAVDPQLTLWCRTMVVFFSEKGSEVSRIEAASDVRMKQQSKEAFGDKAVFTRDSGNIVLTGARPRLLDENGNWIVSRGEGIIYNIHTKIMRVDKPELEVQSSQGGVLGNEKKK
jgi:lipopolysaccharide export system protein LptA